MTEDEEEEPEYEYYYEYVYEEDLPDLDQSTIVSTIPASPSPDPTSWTKASQVPPKTSSDST